MFDLAARYLRAAGWNDWGVVQLKSGSGVVWWFFPPGDATPAAVGKCCLSSQAIAAGRRECAALNALTPYAQELGIPRLLFQGEDKAGFVYLQSGVLGQPLADGLSPNRAPPFPRNSTASKTGWTVSSGWSPHEEISAMYWAGCWRRAIAASHKPSAAPPLKPVRCCPRSRQ